MRVPRCENECKNRLYKVKLEKASKVEGKEEVSRWVNGVATEAVNFGPFLFDFFGVWAGKGGWGEEIRNPQASDVHGAGELMRRV